MITFQYPWLFVLVLCAPLAWYTLPPYRESEHAVRVPWFNRLAQLFKIDPQAGAVIREVGMARLFVRAILWVLVVCALARPQYIEDPITQVIPTRDVLLVVDLSGSMETVDFVNESGEKVDRLTAVKEVLDDFLTQREGDRVGLVVFGNAPFVQVPFTQDLEVSRMLLAETAPRMAGPRTAFGDAIGLGITMFENSKVEDRLMIALTDGNDTGSKIPPTEAARIAADNDIVIHVIGVGDPTAAGEEKLDEKTLGNVASETGGNYYFAADREKLEGIYEEIDKLGGREVQTQSYRPRIDLFHWHLGIFLLISLLNSLVIIVRGIRTTTGVKNHG